MNDRSWMYDQWQKHPRIGLKYEYINGLDIFLEFASRNARTPGVIRCPCAKCKNKHLKKIDEVKFELLKWGYCWKRERAIVVNLEQIRCIITADEVLLLNSLDNYVMQYVVEFQRRLQAVGVDDWQSGNGEMGSRRRSGRKVYDMFGSSPTDDLRFEFRALEVALEAACTFLDSQASELEIEAYLLLDELTSKISTLNLERVRRLKSRLLALTRRIQKVRDEIEKLMDDDGDMAEMYLTEKKRRTKSPMFGVQSMIGYRSTDGAQSLSVLISPVSSPPESRRLEKTLSNC